MAGQGDVTLGVLELSEHRLDDTDGDGLTHITDGKTSKRGVVSESLNAHWLRWNHLYDSGITRLDEFGGIFNPIG